jgi:hypothetical protein
MHRNRLPISDEQLIHKQWSVVRLHSTALFSAIARSAAAFFIIFSPVDRIIGATGFVGLLAGSQRRRSAV